MRPFSRFCLLLVVAALACLSSGCATTNVRAIRAFAYEDPNLVVAIDRVDDIAQALSYLNLLMHETPYSPGDKWIAALELSDKKAEKLKKEIKSEPPYDDNEFTIPVVKLYRLHLEKVVKVAKAANKERKDPAEYASLVEAIKDLADGKDLAEQFSRFRDALEQLEEKERAYSKVKRKYSGRQINYLELPADYQKAQQAAAEAEHDVEVAKSRIATTAKGITKANLERSNRAQIARDTLAAFSVALRIDLESLALIPFILVQMARSLPDAPQQLWKDAKKRKSLSSIYKLADLPDYAVAIEKRLEQQLVMVKAVAEALVRRRHTCRTADPGSLR